jgi:hypothetical protein
VSGLKHADLHLVIMMYISLFFNSTEYSTLFTHLRSVSFNFATWGGDLNDGVQFAIEALGQLPSPHLEFLKIGLLSVKCGSLDFDVWSELGSLLETPRFLSTLEGLVFLFQECRPLITPRAAKIRYRWLQQRFPSYAERGNLHIYSEMG